MHRDSGDEQPEGREWWDNSPPPEPAGPYTLDAADGSRLTLDAPAPSHHLTFILDSDPDDRDAVWAESELTRAEARALGAEFTRWGNTPEPTPPREEVIPK